jgi:uncharacterized protein (DUF2147 family)
MIQHTLLRAARLVAGVGLALGATFAHAQATPAGLWKTIDDDSKQEKSLIRISDSSGVLNGKIEKLLDPATKPDAVCEKCSDDRKDKPLVGLTILRNMKQSADDKGIWEGGDIVDPNNGKVYKARLKPIDGGAKLEMRGYLGPFYRTQVWVRAE